GGPISLCAFAPLRENFVPKSTVRAKPCERAEARSLRGGNFEHFLFSRQAAKPQRREIALRARASTAASGPLVRSGSCALRENEPGENPGGAGRLAPCPATRACPPLRRPS